MPISIHQVMLKVETLIPEAFANKNENSKYQIVCQLLIANEITIRVGTHVSQELSQNVIECALAFMHTIHPILAALPKSMVINMDQTAVFFSMHPNRTLQLSGSRAVNILSSMQNTSRATISVSITADGRVLTPMLTFKGTREGRITTRELPQNPHWYHLFLNHQEKAWVDEITMLDWVEHVLQPYVFAVSLPYAGLHPGEQ